MGHAVGMERIDTRRLAAWTDFLEGHTRVMRLLEKDLKDQQGLTLAEYDVLHRLEQAKDQCLHMSALAEALLYSTGGLTRLVDRMQKRGFVQRRSLDTDRRVIRVGLTDQGMEKLRDASGVHLRGLHRHFGAQLPEDELEAVARFMARLTARS